MIVLKAGRLPNSKALSLAAATIRNGGVVAFSTETSYGLAADPFNRAAVARVFAIKGRSENKPLPLIADGLTTVKKYFLVPKLLNKFTDRWPCALTLVLSRRNGFRLPALRGLRSGGVRVPHDAWAMQLAAASGGLITATSANLSGKPNVYDGDELEKIFAGCKHQPDLIINVGRLPISPPSTIITVHRGKPKVLRQGVEKAA